MSSRWTQCSSWIDMCCHRAKQTGSLFPCCLPLGAKCAESFPCSAPSGMSENYVIFIEQPLKMDLWHIITAKLRRKPISEGLRWEPHCNTRFHVVNKHTGQVGLQLLLSCLFTLQGPGWSGSQQKLLHMGLKASGLDFLERESLPRPRKPRGSQLGACESLFWNYTIAQGLRSPELHSVVLDGKCRTPRRARVPATAAPSLVRDMDSPAAGGSGSTAWTQCPGDGTRCKGMLTVICQDPVGLALLLIKGAINCHPKGALTSRKSGEGEKG